MTHEVPLPPVPPPPSSAAIELTESAASLPWSSWSAGLASAVLHLSVVLFLAVSLVAKPASTSLGFLDLSAADDFPALAELPAATVELPALDLPDLTAWSDHASEIDSETSPEMAKWDGAQSGSGTGQSGAVHGVLSISEETDEAPAATPAGGAEFYGLQATGERFVFVVDCSSSMAGAKWQAACGELLASLRRLGDYRSFFVILFDGQAHPMFGPEAVAKVMLPATDENVAQVERWLQAVELGNNTRPYSAMQQAVALQPHAVFLLTDGEFTDPTAEYLKRNNVRREKGKRVPVVRVHTVGLYSRKNQEMLKRIARDNGGNFRFVAREIP